MDASFLSSLTLATLSVARHPGLAVVVVESPAGGCVSPCPQAWFYQTCSTKLSSNPPQPQYGRLTYLLILLTTTTSGLESSSVPVVKHNY